MSTKPRIALERLFQRRLIDQLCPHCALREAGGRYCSNCLTPTGLPNYLAARMVELDGVVIARRNDLLTPITILID
jgi:hypothetical protein